MRYRLWNPHAFPRRGLLLQRLAIQHVRLIANCSPKAAIWAISVGETTARWLLCARGIAPLVAGSFGQMRPAALLWWSWCFCSRFELTQNFISVRAPCRRDGAHHERDRFQSLFACSEPKYHSVLCPALVKHLLVGAPVNFRRSQACTEPINCSRCKSQIRNALTVWNVSVDPMILGLRDVNRHQRCTPRQLAWASASCQHWRCLLEDHPWSRKWHQFRLCMRQQSNRRNPCGWIGYLCRDQRKTRKTLSASAGGLVT